MATEDDKTGRKSTEDGGEVGEKEPKRRLGFLVGLPALLLAGVVSYFLPGILRGATSKVIGQPAPLSVEVRTDIDQFDYSGVAHVPEFVVARPAQDIGPPPNPKVERSVGTLADTNQRGRWAWAHQLGGVDANETLLRVTIQGREEAPVTLQGLQVRVIERRPPLSGNTVSYLGIGSSVSPDTVSIDLDADPPVTKFVDRSKNELRSFTFEVSKTDIQRLNILAVTGTCDCTWVGKLDYTFGGKPGEITLDDHGKPFRTTSTRNAPACYWSGSDWSCPSPPG